MSPQEWPADNYAIGSYIQASIAEKYLPDLLIKPTDHVLDLGCGNGAFTKKILDKTPQGTVLGVDASENMLKLAQNVTKEYPNFFIEKADALAIQFQSQFDYVVSFWCLQWVRDIHKAFENIFNALKPGGKIFLILPVGDDPYIKGYYALKKSNQFSALKDFHPPVDYLRLENLAQKLEDLPFKNLKITPCKQSIRLPSLDTFKKFVNGLAFYQGQVPEKEIVLINDALVQYFVEECKAKYQGEYEFHLTIYLVTGEK